MRSDQARAEALFKKEERQRDGQKAMAEYETAQRAVREKTARLRALRLARDAAAKPSVPSAKRAGATRSAPVRDQQRQPAKCPAGAPAERARGETVRRLRARAL
jgi:hypothetical protein